MSTMRTDLGPNGKVSFAPLGLDHYSFVTHGLRRGLYSYAAPRLRAKSPPCRKRRDEDGVPAGKLHRSFVGNRSRSERFRCLRMTIKLAPYFSCSRTTSEILWVRAT